MSWAEEQSWFGFEDLALEALYGSSYDADVKRLEIVWVCKDGTAMRIEDMTTEHIINCIAMIQSSILNNKPWRTNYLPIFKKELNNRQFLTAIRNMSDEEFNKIVHKKK